MNPGASPYWTQELPVLEAPDGAEAAADSSGSNNNNNNNAENLLEDKESREQALQGMGQDKWENNPTPRCTYSERRKKMERELRQAKEGSERVSKLETPAKKTAPKGKKYTEPKISGGKANVPEAVVVEV